MADDQCGHDAPGIRSVIADEKRQLPGLLALMHIYTKSH
jgi:hypothetical protein